MTRAEILGTAAIRERLLREAPAADTVAALATSDDAAGLVDGPLRPAAVLVGIVQGADPGVLLTVRNARMRAHAGQVAFPGGRIEPGEIPENAALREAQEEVGLDPGTPELLGRLPGYVTGTGYHVTPILALVPEGVDYQLNPDEVDSVFMLPLSVVLDPAAPERRSREWRGRERRFWVWPHDRHYIWGATAAILVHLAARLREAA